MRGDAKKVRTEVQENKEGMKAIRAMKVYTKIDFGGSADHTMGESEWGQESMREWIQKAQHRCRWLVEDQAGGQ